MRQQLGRAFSVLARHEADEQLAHVNIDLFGAPSEIHVLYIKSLHKRARRARRVAHSVSGLTNYQFRKALRQLRHRDFNRAVTAILMRDPRYNPPQEMAS